MALTPTLLANESQVSLTASYTTASISPTANTLLVVCIAMKKLFGTAGGSVAVSGLSLTWTNRVHKVQSDGWVDCFTAPAGASPGSGTLGISVSGNASDQRWSDIIVHILQVPVGFDTTTPVAQVASNGASGNTTGATLTVTFGGTPATDSVVIGFIGSMETNGAVTADGTFTELAQDSNGNNDYMTASSQYDDASADTTTQWTAIDRLDGGKHTAALAIEIAAAAGGPTYTLALDAGSYAVTGNAAGLVANRKLPLNTGSYTVTGQSAALVAGRKLPLDAGAYAITGQSAGLVASRKLALDAGSYTVTGQDALLKVSRKLALDAGSYTLTGLDVTLVYTPVGGPTYTLALDAGSYTVTGNAVGLIVNRVLQAEAGAYTVTGQDASLIVRRILAAEAGNYTVTGNDALFKVSRKLALATGNYAITGLPITLLYSGALIPDVPIDRIYVIAAEDRIYVIPAENRVYPVH